MNGAWFATNTATTATPLTVERLELAIEELERRRAALGDRPFYIVSPHEYARMKAEHEATK